VNTVGDPLEGAWYTKRHYYKPMSIDELVKDRETRMHRRPTESGQS